MREYGDLLSVSVTPDSPTNGALSDYTIQVVPNTALANGSAFEVVFPAQITLP